MFVLLCVVFFFKQNTAYELRISDWSSDVCSSDLIGLLTMNGVGHFKSSTAPIEEACLPIRFRDCRTFSSAMSASRVSQLGKSYGAVARRSCRLRRAAEAGFRSLGAKDEVPRSEEHKSELQ